MTTVTFPFARISAQTRIDFTKNFSVLLKSGISINDALSMLAEQSESLPMRLSITRVRDDIENGTPLSAAFEKESQIYGIVFVGLVRAGEQSGTLEHNLAFLSEWLVRNADMRREVSAAMLYPKLVFGASVLLGGSLAVFILPRLIPVFAKLNVELPLATRALLAFSVFIQHYWFLTLLAGIATVGLLLASARIPRVRAFYHRALMNLPFVGGIARKYQLALSVQLLAVLLRSGLSLSDSIDVVSRSSTNVYYRSIFAKVGEDIAKGTALSASLGTYPRCFPKIFVTMVSVAEKSGTLANSFEYLAEYYGKEVSSFSKKLPTIVEPILLILIAAIVGFVALSIVLPIYKLTGSIGR